MCKVYPGYWAWSPCCHRYYFYRQGHSMIYEHGPATQYLCPVQDCGKFYFWHCYPGPRLYRRWHEEHWEFAARLWKAENPELLDRTVTSLERYREMKKYALSDYVPRAQADLPSSSRMLQVPPSPEQLWNPQNPPDGWNADADAAEWVLEAAYADSELSHVLEDDDETVRGSASTERQYHDATEEENGQPFYDALDTTQTIQPDQSQDLAMLGAQQERIESGFLNTPGYQQGLYLFWFRRGDTPDAELERVSFTAPAHYSNPDLPDAEQGPQPQVWYHAGYGGNIPF